MARGSQGTLPRAARGPCQGSGWGGAEARTEARPGHRWRPWPCRSCVTSSHLCSHPSCLGGPGPGPHPHGELQAGARFGGGGHPVQPPGPLAPYLGEPLPRVWRAGRAHGRQALAPGFATRPPTSVLPSRRRWPLPLPTLLPGPSRRWQRCQVKLRMPRETWVSAGPQMRFNCEWVQV